MLISKKASVGDLIATDMDTRLSDPEYQSIFKTAAKKKVEPKHGDKDHKCSKDCPKKEDKKKKKKLSKAEQVKLSIDGLVSISAVLDEMGFEKSAISTLNALEELVSEAAKKKDKKKEEKSEEGDEDKNADDDSDGDAEDEEEADEGDAEDCAPEEEEESKHDSNDAAPKAAPKGNSGSAIDVGLNSVEGYGNAADDGSADDEDKDEECMDAEDGTERKLPEHEPKAPIKNAPKSRPEQSEREPYKHEWERDKIDLGEVDDNNAGDGEELRALLSELGLQAESEADFLADEEQSVDDLEKEASWDDYDVDYAPLYLNKFAKKAKPKGEFVFSASHPKVKDNTDHFPINTEGRARNALARASQFSKAPKWYKGSLEEFVRAVSRAVRAKYKGIKVTKKSDKPGKG